MKRQSRQNQLVDGNVSDSGDLTISKTRGNPRKSRVSNLWIPRSQFSDDRKMARTPALEGRVAWTMAERTCLTDWRIWLFWEPLTSEMTRCEEQLYMTQFGDRNFHSCLSAPSQPSCARLHRHLSKTPKAPGVKLRLTGCWLIFSRHGRQGTSDLEPKRFMPAAHTLLKGFCSCL
jgi:hypothetical protein